MTKLIAKTKATKITCPICNKPGYREPVERLPQGILWRFNHEGQDGEQETNRCQWAVLDPEIMFKKQKTLDIKCPVCGLDGIVYSEKARIKDVRVRYRVRHPQSRLENGESKRCTIGQEHRNLILQMFGRYIEPVSSPKKCYGCDRVLFRLFYYNWDEQDNAVCRRCYLRYDLRNWKADLNRNKRGKRNEKFI